MVKSILSSLEHWAVKFKYLLDPKSSDYIYKHHLSHLEEIYQNRRFEVKEPPRKLIMSPASQLYGVNGKQKVRKTPVLSNVFFVGIKSNRPLQKQVEKSRESKWVDNFQKFKYLDDRLTNDIKQHLKEQTQARNPSPGPLSRKKIGDTKISQDKASEEEGEEDLEGEFGNSGQSGFHFSRKATNEELSDTDLIMFGMYRLNPQQEEIYRQFVEMVSGFSQFDQVCKLFRFHPIFVKLFFLNNRRVSSKMHYMMQAKEDHR